MDNLTPMTKVEFKRLHKAGELLLVDAAPIPLEKAVDVVNTAIKEERLPEGRQVVNGSHGFIDTAGRRVYQDEANSIVYLETIFTYGGRDAFNTTVYRMS